MNEYLYELTRGDTDTISEEEMYYRANKKLLKHKKNLNSLEFELENEELIYE